MTVIFIFLFAPICATSNSEPSIKKMHLSYTLDEIERLISNLEYKNALSALKALKKDKIEFEHKDFQHLKKF